MHTTTPRRVELYVRSLTSRTGDGPQERALDRLRRLAAEGAIESFRVRVWGDQVGLSTTAVETDRGEAILERIGAFRKWADRTGATFDGVFETREAASSITGEEYTTIRLPVVVMGEYDDGELVQVTPHERDGTRHTVEDRLEELSAVTAEQESREQIRP